MRKRTIRVFIVVLIAALFVTGCSFATAGGLSDSSIASSAPSGDDNASSGPESSSAASSEVPVTEDKAGLGKVLIVYYSFTGNTREVADLLKDKTGGATFEIEPDFDYNRPDVEAVAKEQVNEGFKPKLKTAVSDIETYDVIFVGSPIWWFSVTPPVMSFLSETDLAGKKVVPFCTYIDAYGDFFKQFEAACPDAQVVSGRDFKSAELKDSDALEAKIDAWLAEIKEG